MKKENKNMNAYDMIEYRIKKFEELKELINELLNKSNRQKQKIRKRGK